MKPFCVKLYYSGVQTFYITAPDDGEAVDCAYDELANLHQLDDLEVTTIGDLLKSMLAHPNDAYHRN